jgi:hypothetical protein
VSSRWRKAKGYTTVMGLAILDLLFIIFCLVRRQRVATHSAH